jgi:hypothetical protein
LDDLRLNELTWVRVPDGVEVDEVDFSKLEADVLGHVDSDRPSHLEVLRIRDWVTVKELAGLLRVNVSTVNRWLQGEHLPTKRWKRPWNADAIPVCKNAGGSFRRIWIPGVNASLFSTELQQRRLDEVLARWPNEQGWGPSGRGTDRCRKPLELPPPFDQRLLEETRAQSIRAPAVADNVVVESVERMASR